MHITTKKWILALPMLTMVAAACGSSSSDTRSASTEHSASTEQAVDRNVAGEPGYWECHCCDVDPDPLHGCATTGGETGKGYGFSTGNQTGAGCSGDVPDGTGTGTLRCFGPWPRNEVPGLPGFTPN